MELIGESKGAFMRMPSCYLFSGLAERQLDQLTAVGAEIPMKKGDWIIHEGWEAPELYILMQGEVELITSVNGYFELPIAMLRIPGEAVGIASLVPPHIYSLSARCAKSGALWAIRSTEFSMLMKNDTGLGCIVMKNLAQYLLDRLKETRQELRVHFRALFKSTH